MAEVLVRNVDDNVTEHVKARAPASGRTLQAELKLILEEAARPANARPTRAEYSALANQVRAAIVDRPQTDSAELLAEDPAR